MRDGTVPVQQTANKAQEETIRHLDPAERQALSLRQTRFFKPPVEFDVAELHSVRVTLLPNRCPSAADAREKCLDKLTVAGNKCHVAAGVD
jgi:hypothetical protein